MVTFSRKGEPPKKGGDDDLPSIVRATIEQIPDIRDLEITPIRNGGRAASGAKEATDDVRRAGGRGAARDIPAEVPAVRPNQIGPGPAGSTPIGPGPTASGQGQDDRGIVRAANDDRESVGHIMQPLQRRPARTPYIIAILFTALWAIAAAALAYGFSAHLRQISAEAGLAPTVIGLCGAFGAPIVFFFALASMIARLNELRIVSNSMAEATLRFAQPETAAHDSIMSIGQAIRREVAAMGDGVERALARAVELESLVNNEVAVLERAYSDNEVRIRNLLAGLAQQREILVGQAEQVRNAITHVHLDLSQDVTTVSELIAERVNETAQRVTQALADKGEQITVALGSAGDTMIEQLGARGANLLKQLETTSENATHAIDVAGDKLTSGLNFKSDQINEQVLSIAASLQQSLATRLDDVVGGFSQKSSSVLTTVENHTRELSATISERSETVSRALIETTGRIAETIASRADDANHSLKTTGESIVLDLSLRGSDMVSKLEDIGQKITESIVSRSDYITQQFGNHAESLTTSIASRSDMMRDMLAQRLESYEQMFSHSGVELAERIARDSAQLGNLITRHLADFDRTVRGHGSEIVDSLTQRTADLQELVAAAVTSRDDALAAVITGRIDEANAALAARAAEVADTVESQVGRFEEMLVGRVGKAVSEVEARTKTAAELASSSIDRIAHEVGTRTGAAVERAAILVGKATEAIESRTHAAADFAALRLAGATEDLETRSAAAADFAASRLANATEQMEMRAVSATEDMTVKVRDAAHEVGKHTADLSNLLDTASSRLIAAISSKGGEFAAEIEQAAESAARAIDTKAFAFTQSMMSNSNELARVITDASNSAAAIVNRTLKDLQDSTRNSLSQATVMVAQILKELQQATKGAIEQSKDVAISTVSEIHETHDMLHSDATALFERLRDANDLLQSVLGGARTNLSAIEQVLSTRVVEFVSTVERLLESTDSASGKLDRQVSSFYALTSRVLGDLSELAVQFEGHGKALGDAVNVLERANDDTLASVSGRKNAIEELAAAMDGRTEQLETHLRRFSNMIDVSLRSAEDRARDAARLVVEATSEGARTLAERHAAIRSTTEQESKQTLHALRELHQRVSAEAKDLFQQNAGEANDLLQQATDRFAEIMHGMKKMSVDMQRELETTRKELRRGVLELPEETAESMAQMRKVIVDQMEALAELNRIVARHGRAMDAVGAADPSAARGGYGDEDPVIAPLILPESAVRVEPAAAGRGRPLPPGAGTTDWNSLQQRGRTEPSPEPPARATAAAPERSATPRGRAEPPTPEPPARAARSTPGSDRNGSQRGRVEPPLPEPPRPAASEWSTPRGLYEAPPVAPAGHDAGKGADGGGGWLSNLLTRASKDGDGASHGDDRGAAKPGRPAAPKERAPPDDGSKRHGIEPAGSLSSDVARMVDQDVAADLWKRYNRGERNISSRRLYTPQGRKAFEEMRKRYNSDREFREVVDSYIGGVDQILGQVDVTSETGQIYTLLAHAAGRFE